MNFKCHGKSYTIKDKPKMDASEIVNRILTSLQNNDNPTKNYGLKYLFHMSSQENRIALANYHRNYTPDKKLPTSFIELMNNNIYAPLINHTQFKILDKSLDTINECVCYLSIRIYFNKNKNNQISYRDYKFYFERQYKPDWNLYHYWRLSAIMMI